MAEPKIDRKPDPNHQRRLRVLRSLTPQQKLDQVFQRNHSKFRINVWN